MRSANEEAFGEDQTLAHLLEFLSKLQQSHVKTKVITEIKENVEEYFKDYDQQFGNPTTGYLFETIKKSSELRSNIVVSDQNYKHYETAFDEDNSIEAKKYAKHLINNVFPLLGCLYYMYYECSQEGYYIEGGEWSNEKCDGSEHGEQKKHLNKWLQDLQGQNVKSSDRSSTLMIKRGFSDISLSDNSGQTLFPPGQHKTKNLLSYEFGAQLQYCLYYMLLLPDDGMWDHAQSGHAVLFLEAFCKEVKDGEFQDKYRDNGDSFKRACQKVEQSITALIQSKTIVPVATQNKTVMYKNLLEVTHFWKYIGWLIQNLSRLLVSLTEMEHDVSKWDKDKQQLKKKLKESKTFGPYPWGFTFAYNWESRTEEFKSKLQELITALKTFQSALEKIKPVSSSAATVGGVIGGLGTLGAAGAAGAAAYSGILGHVAEGIGKFFKGLLW